jgi:hypothetical protein
VNEHGTFDSVTSGFGDACPELGSPNAVLRTPIWIQILKIIGILKNIQIHMNTHSKVD